MTAPDDVRACPFCGNAKMEIHHNTQAGITFLLCGDDQGRGGCGAVVSFRPNLTGGKAVKAYNRRAAHADLAGEVRELVEAHRLALATIDDYLAYEHDGDPWKEDARAMGEMDINDFARDGRLERCKAALAKFTHQEKP